MQFINCVCESNAKNVNFDFESDFKTDDMFYEKWPGTQPQRFCRIHGVTVSRKEAHSNAGKFSSFRFEGTPLMLVARIEVKSDDSQELSDNLDCFKLLLSKTKSIQQMTDALIWSMDGCKTEFALYILDYVRKHNIIIFVLQMITAKQLQDQLLQLLLNIVILKY